MQRRAYLATLGSATALAVAGCSGGSEDTTALGYRTDTPQPAGPPEVQRLALVSEWQEFGDVVDNAIDELAAGDTATLGVRYRVYVADQTLDVTTQATVRHDGRRVAFRSLDDEQIRDSSGWSRFETWWEFDTGDWEPGEHTAEALIRDNQSDTVSEKQTVSFDVV
jgi:hypothetical protein